MGHNVLMTFSLALHLLVFVPEKFTLFCIFYLSWVFSVSLRGILCESSTQWGTVKCKYYLRTSCTFPCAKWNWGTEVVSVGHGLRTMSTATSALSGLKNSREGILLTIYNNILSLQVIKLWACIAPCWAHVYPYSTCLAWHWSEVSDALGEFFFQGVCVCVCPVLSA